MSVTTSYSIAHLNLQVECEDEILSYKVIRALDAYFYLKTNGSIADTHHVRLKFNNKIAPFQSPENVRELFTSPHFRVLKNGDSCYLADEKSFFQLDLTNCCGTGYLDQTFWDRPPKSQQELLMLSFLWLFHKHGLFAIHGNALVKDKLGIFLVGDTCCGKSTSSLSLIRKGWSYLSDDVTLLAQSAQGVKALAFLKGFSFSPRLAGYYPELSKHLKASSWNGEKRFLDINPIYPGSYLPLCVPNVLIFPRIVSERKSRLIPINKTSALILLIKNSGGIMVDKDMASQQIGVLKDLIDQTSSYEFLAGRDLYEKPEKISLMLQFN